MDITRSTRHGVPFYSCPHPAWAGAAHGFSTRLGGVSPAPWDSLNLGAARGDSADHVEENFCRFCAALGTSVSALVKNHQVHGTVIRPVTHADRLPSPAQPGTADGDGLVTDQPSLCLTIFSGDCIPILLYDPVRRVVACAHAGWRGTAAGIASCAVKAMTDGYGCTPQDILAAIGPGISPCCFETHADVPRALQDAMGGDAQPFIRPLPSADKFQVDLKGVNARWLQLAGLDPAHIATCSACTACQPDSFWSHRMQGAARGSMAAMIELV